MLTVLGPRPRCVSGAVDPETVRAAGVPPAEPLRGHHHARERVEGAGGRPGRGAGAPQESNKIQREWASVISLLTFAPVHPQIVTYLRQHAHPHVARKVPVVPETVSDQIRLWVCDWPCRSPELCQVVCCAVPKPPCAQPPCAAAHKKEPCAVCLDAGPRRESRPGDDCHALRLLRHEGGVPRGDGLRGVHRGEGAVERRCEDGVHRQVCGSWRSLLRLTVVLLRKV